MKLARLAALAAAVFLLVPAGVTLAQPKFPALTGRVVDEAGVLSAPAEQKLNEDLARLEAETGRQLVVATVTSLQGYEIEDYGYQLGRTWGIGQREKDDGVVFLVAPTERKVRIEVGYGLEPILTDALSSVILQTRVLPPFREGRIEQGVVDGAEAIAQQLALPPEEAQARVAAAAQAQDDASPASVIPVAIFVIFVVLWIIGGVSRSRGGRGSGWWLLPLILSNSGGGRRGGGFGGGGFGGGGFSGGGGGFGGGGSSGSW